MHVLTTVDPDEIAQLRERDEFFWIDLSSPSDEDIARLGEALGLHPVALEDTREFGQRPKLDPYGNHLLLVFYTAVVSGDAGWPADPVEIHIYLSGSYMVTVRRDMCSIIEALRRDLRDEEVHEEEMIIYRLLDTLTDAFYPVIEAVEASVDDLEREVLQPPAARAPEPLLPAQAVRAPTAPPRLRPARPVPERARRDRGPGGPHASARGRTCATSATTCSRSPASSSARSRT